MPGKRDLRKHPRLNPLVIKAEFESGEKRGEGYVTNLSAGGAFLATSEALTTDDILFLVVQLPWKLGRVLMGGKVVWRNDSDNRDEGGQPVGVGVQFTSLSPEAEDKLNLFMQKFSDLAAKIEEVGE